MGAFIGDALGLGPHWYYDVEEQQREFGPWIDGYTTPKAGRYHEGMQAGELSQTGIIMKLLLHSVAERGGYDEENFTERLDRDLLPHLDGTPLHGPGGFTNYSFRQLWKARVQEGKHWDAVASHADLSDAAERSIILAARYAQRPAMAADSAFDNVRLTQSDSLVQQHSVAFASVVAALVRGESLSADLSDHLMELVEQGTIPFTAPDPLSQNKRPEGRRAYDFPSPDALLLPSWCAQSAHDPAIQIEPAWKVAQLYGMSCAINFVLPASYYLAARFAGDFEQAVLHALNGGGQNMSRACLTGALAGAQCGLSQIPERFVTGLREHAELVPLAQAVGAAAARETPAL